MGRGKKKHRAVESEPLKKECIRPALGKPKNFVFFLSHRLEETIGLKNGGLDGKSRFEEGAHKRV